MFKRKTSFRLKYNTLNNLSTRYFWTEIVPELGNLVRARFLCVLEEPSALADLQLKPAHSRQITQRNQHGRPFSIDWSIN